MVAKKKVVKKPATSRNKNLIPLLMRFKLVTGEELVAYVDQADDQIIAVRPVTVTLYQELVLLTPYGLSAKNRDVFLFPSQSVIEMYEVDEQFSILYTVAVETNYAYTKEYYDQMVFNSIQSYRRQLEKRNATVKGPTNEELEKIENEKKPKTVSVTASVTERSKSDIVDSLVELAEKAGKGKKLS